MLFNHVVLFETQKMSTIATSQLPFSIYFSKTVAIMDFVEMEKIMILSKWTNQWLQQNLLVVLARDFLMSFVAMVTYAEGIHLVRVYAVSFISEICLHTPFPQVTDIGPTFRPNIRDTHIKCSKQFKWNSYFYVSGQSRPFWAALTLLQDSIMKF